MNISLGILAVVIVGILLWFSALWWLFLKFKSKLKTTEPNQKATDDLAFEILPYELIKNQLNGDLSFLKKQGNWLSHSGITSAYFVHGTFVGNDPFNIIDHLEYTFPKLNPAYLEKIRTGIRKSANILARDIGNFSQKYEQTFQNITHEKIKTLEFTWSSANTHFARVKAALNLIDNIYHHHPDIGSRVLLIGHSHAGQIFSLLSQVVNDERFRKNLKKLLEENKIVFNLQESKITHLANMKLDFVTFGTPVRYIWILNRNNRLLHFINHRGNTPFGGELKGLFTTKTGDYIQQWGTEGSDSISISKRGGTINKQLDTLLGSGRNVQIMRENISKRNRLHNLGNHLLVDYGDNSYFPNFAKTVFGHGVYTQVKFLPFHLYMINKHLYPRD